MSSRFVSPSHLVLATRQEDLATVKRLCALDPAVAGRATEDGSTALQVACSVGNFEIVEHLLSCGASKVVNSGSKQAGLTPLMLASAVGNYAIVEALIAQGAKANVADVNGWTALHHAAFKGHADVCELLLASPGSEPNRTTKKADSALALAALMKHEDTCLVLLDHGAQTSFLRSPADREFVERLLLGEPEGGEEVGAPGGGRSRLPADAASQAYSDEFEEDIEEDEGEEGDLDGADGSARGSQGGAADGEGHEVHEVHPEDAGPPPPEPGSGVVPMPGGTRRQRPMYLPHLMQSLGQGRNSALRSSGGSVYAASPRGTAPQQQQLPPVNTTGQRAPSALPPLRNPSAPSSPSGATGPRRLPSPQHPSTPTGGAARARPAPAPLPAARSSAYADRSPQASPKGPHSRRVSNAAGAETKPPAGGWTLHAFSYKGLPEGLLLDKETCLVYWMDPALQQQRLQQQEEELARQQEAEANGENPEEKKKPQQPPPLPVLVGKLVPGVGGIDAPSYGRIAPLTTNDCGTIELSRSALRCLRKQSPVAAMLLAKARLPPPPKGEQQQYDEGSDGEAPPPPPPPDAPPLAADFAPELGAQPYARGVSLAVPICAVLGVRDVAELASLTERDLLMCEVDTSFLPALLEAAGAGGNDGGRSSGSTVRTRPGTAASRPRTATGSPSGALSRERSSASLADAKAAEDQAAAEEGSRGPALPTLPQLLAKHGLMKLLPLAAERKLLAASEIHRWNELASSATTIPMSRIEIARLKALMASIRSAQEAALSMQASRMELLMRLTVGSLVLYEADPLRAALRGERLVGVVLEDLGPGMGASGKQFKVRDMLDDSLSWLTPGQVRRLSPAEAQSHLRADLLPPTTMGAPVTPLSALPGLPVQIASWPWTPPAPAPAGANGMGPAPAGADPDPGGKLMALVIGTLVEPASPDGLAWKVRWPDEAVRVHSVGANGRFELVHLQLHKLAGAPLSHRHFAHLLCGQEMLCVPVVRSPLWPRAATDDTVPGTPGVGFLDAAQTALSVVWSRSRDQEPCQYSPDAQGLYPLCHGLLGGTPLTALGAKEGVMVEPGPGGALELAGAAAGGPGALVAPVRMGTDNQSVVWRVKWPSGAITEHDLGMKLMDPELVVAESFMQPTDNRIALLNEVTKRNAAMKGGAAAAAANTSAQAAAVALEKTMPAAAATASAGRIGRPLFCKNAALAAQAGMLGVQVKMNLAALALQPGCEQGPMMSYEPQRLADVLAAKKEGNSLGPPPRDDVGIVLRDLGPGAWRGLLVRKYGTTEGFWYDEAVLLPAAQEDLAKQVLRKGAAYVMPRHLQGVPVTEANAAPGMLVQRAYAPGAVLEGSEKASMVGELLRPAGPHMWEVKWPDGTVGVYKTGARNKFQLCYVNLHERSGCPLLWSTVGTLAGAGAGRIPVIEGPHSVVGGMPPGTVRFVNDPNTQQGLLQQEVAQLAAAGMVATSAGERRFAGGMLKLYELSHAIVPGEALTVYTAKRGLRVALAERQAASATDGTDTGAEDASVDGSAPPPRPPSKVGVLLGPSRLAVRAVLDAGSGAGSGAKGGPTASREAVLLMDGARCYWEVQWDNGRVEEFLVGTLPLHTSLRVAPGPEEPRKEDQEEDEEVHEDEDGNALPKKDVSVEAVEHYVRIVEPLMLLPSGLPEHDDNLVRLATPLQRAIGWNNQLMRELCRVWWAAARVAAAMEEGASEHPAHHPWGSRKLLWRPHMQMVGTQPDSVSLQIKWRPGRAGVLRWKVMVEDKEGLVSKAVPEELDQQLADAVSMLASALAGPARKPKKPPQIKEIEEGEEEQEEGEEEGGAAAPPPEDEEEPLPQLHLVLTEDGQFLAPGVLTDSSGRSVHDLPPGVQEAVDAVNTALRAYRAALRGPEPDEHAEEEDPEGEGKPQFDIAFAIEPSMGGEGSKAHGSAMITMVRELPPPLQRAAKPAGAEEGGAEGGSNGEDAEGGEEQQQGAEGSTVAGPPPSQGGVDDEEDGVEFPAGPAALLTTAAIPKLHSCLLHAHRALGALGSISPAQPANEEEGEGAVDEGAIQLAGGKQYSLWLDVPEHPMPQKLGAVRCLASINVQLFTLRRLCARLNGAEGAGSANVCAPLLQVLHLIHAKAMAGVMADAAVRRSKEALSLAEKGKDTILEQENGATDIKPFAWKAAAKLLEAVREALGSLQSAEGAAADARAYAHKAELPMGSPVVEEEDVALAEAAAKAAGEAVNKTADAQHRCFPVAAVAVHKCALSLTALMRSRLLDAEEAYAAARAAAQKALEIRQASDKADKAARSAEDDARAAHEAEQRKIGELEKAKQSVVTSERNLREAQEMLSEAQASLPGARAAAEHADAGKAAHPMPPKPVLAEGETLSEEAAAAQKAREVEAKEYADRAKEAHEALSNAQNAVTNAEAALQEAVDRLEKIKRHAVDAESEVEKARQAAKEADVNFDNRRAQAEDAVKLAAAAQRAADEAMRSARKLDPGSVVTPQRGTQAEQAARTAETTEAALGMLHELQVGMPSSLRAPEAVARLLGRLCSIVALVGATTAAEWARTSCIPLESFLLDLEQQESEWAAAQTLAAAAEKQGGNMGASLGTTSRSVSSSQGGAAGGAFVPQLKPLPEVVALLGCIKSDLTGALAAYKRLLPQVDAETTLKEKRTDAAAEAEGEGEGEGEEGGVGAGGAGEEDGPNPASRLRPPEQQDLDVSQLGGAGSGPEPQAQERTLSATLLTSTLERSVLSAATTMEKLASAALANVTAAAAEAKAAGEAAAAAVAAGGGPPNPVASAAAQAAKAAEYLPRALKAARVAALAAEAVGMLPAPADVPISDAKLSQVLTAALKNSVSMSNKAQQGATLLANDIAAKLMKTQLGSAASPASVLCSAYADLSRAAEKGDEAEYWAMEAAGVWSKARAAADAALAALVPPPPAAGAGGEGEEGEDDAVASSGASDKGGDKEKGGKDSGEAAAKAAANAEAERAISSYMANTAVKLAKAAVDWARKFLDPLSETLPELTRGVLVAAAEAEHAEAAASIAAAQADQPKPKPKPHPHAVVEALRQLAAPLRLSDMASREAGNHTELAEVDEAIQDILALSCDGGKQLVNQCTGYVQDVQSKDEPPSEAEGKAARGALSSARLVLDLASELVRTVPLVLPPEMVDNALEEIHSVLEQELVPVAVEVMQRAADAAPRKAVAGAFASGEGQGLVLSLQVRVTPREQAQDVESSGRRPKTAGGRGGANEPPPPPPAFDLDFVFAPPPGAPALTEGEEASKPSETPATGILERPTVRAMLLPYRMLMEAANETMAAVAAAMVATPSERDIAEAVQPKEDPMAEAPAPTANNGACCCGEAASATNAAQLQRWGPTVANMAAAVQLVVHSFHEASELASQTLQPLTLPFDILPKEPQRAEGGDGDEAGGSSY